MKKLLLASVAATALTAGGGAMAADWSGPYAGIQLGATNYAPQFGDPEYNHSGGMENGTTKVNYAIGGQVGWNFQVNNLILGVELNVDRSEAKSEAGSGVCGGNACSSQYAYTSTLHGMESLRLRVGVPMGENLVYALTGAGQIHADHKYYDSSPAPQGAENVTASAFLLGGGIETNMGNNLTARIEYVYYDAGEENVMQWGEQYTLTPNVGVFSAAVNYKF